MFCFSRISKWPLKDFFKVKTSGASCTTDILVGSKYLGRESVAREIKITGSFSFRGADWGYVTYCACRLGCKTSVSREGESRFLVSEVIDTIMCSDTTAFFQYWEYSPVRTWIQSLKYMVTTVLTGPVHVERYGRLHRSRNQSAVLGTKDIIFQGGATEATA